MDYKKTFFLVQTSSAPFYDNPLPNTAEPRKLAFRYPETPGDNLRRVMNFSWADDRIGDQESLLKEYTIHTSQVFLGGSRDPQGNGPTYQSRLGLAFLDSAGNPFTERQEILDEIGRKTAANLPVESNFVELKFEIAPPHRSTRNYYSSPDDGIIPEWWKNETEWAKYINDHIIGVYQDHAFDTDAVFLKKTASERIRSYEPDGAGAIKTPYIEIEPFYNFYIGSYEKSITDISASLLPNLYAFYSEMSSVFKDSRPSRFKNHIDLGGAIKETFIDIVNQKGEKIGEKSKGQYFEKYADSINKYISGSLPTPQKNNIDHLQNDYRNLIFPSTNVTLLSEVEGKQTQFPMGIKVEFTTDNKSEFTDIINESRMFSYLVTNFINPISANIKTNEEFAEKEIAPNPGFRPKRVSTDTFDLGTWITRISDRTFNSTALFDNVVLLGEQKEEIEAASYPEYSLYRKMMTLFLKNKFHKLIPSNFRSYKDILEGKKCYSETIFYRISRHRHSEDGTFPLEQDIWLPNLQDLDVMKYYDTQVKYDTPYRYIVRAYNLVMGNEYSYEVEGGSIINQIGFNERTGDTYAQRRVVKDITGAKICLYNQPSIKLISTVYYDSSTDFPGGVRIKDKPPISPNVNVVPYRGIDDKILFWLNGSVGSIEQTFIPILESDIENMGEYARGVVTFQSDDPAQQFQIFRTTKPPVTYSDFSSFGEPIRVEAPDADSAAYVDTIVANRKYYYTFRAVDVHGHISNPTEVYEVELVKNDENVFALINLYDMERPPPRQLNKPARRFIKIEPSLLQLAFDENELAKKEKHPWTSNNISNFRKLLAEKSIFGTGNDDQKKFKVRLVSKNSGKKIDLNLKFKFRYED